MESEWKVIRQTVLAKLLVIGLKYLNIIKTLTKLNC